MIIEPLLFDVPARPVPPIPSDIKGGERRPCGYTATAPREWTDGEVEWVLQMRADGYSPAEIAESTGRSETSIAIKMKRLGKRDNTYNDRHRDEKYAANMEFLTRVKPFDILDLYCGTESWWQNHTSPGTVETNDIDTGIKALNHKPADRLIAELYGRGCSYDLIDLDPYGSAYDCFDLALRMARKAVIVTFGEMGHKRWKRLDFVRSHYGIETLSEFTTGRLIEEFRRIGRRHKKDATPVIVKEWPRISRVYFELRPIKITEQWER